MIQIFLILLWVSSTLASSANSTNITSNVTLEYVNKAKVVPTTNLTSSQSFNSTIQNKAASTTLSNNGTMSANSTVNKKAVSSPAPLKMSFNVQTQNVKQLSGSGKIESVIKKMFNDVSNTAQTAENQVQLMASYLVRSVKGNLASSGSSTDENEDYSASPFKANYALHKRSDQAQVVITINNSKTYYSVPLKIGSNKQEVAVLLDTGSSDLWVPTVQNSADGHFTPGSSSSFQATTSKFGIMYGDGTYAKGEWGYDDVTIGTMDVQNVQFGVCNNVTATQGVLGIGLAANEASSTKYRNFPEKMVDGGYIKDVSYSLYLGSADASSGEIIFGGIDTEKYSGSLVTLDLVKIDDSGSSVSDVTAFFVELKSIKGTLASYSSNTYPALLDSGTTLIYAPKAVYQSFATKYGYYVSGIGYINKCDKFDKETLAFEFNGVTIEAQMKDIMFPLYKSDGTAYKSLFGSPLCLVGIQDSGTDTYILGDSFLRSAYVYYDLTKGNVQMAQVAYTSKSNVQMV